jgi:hypothetical protein
MQTIQTEKQTELVNALSKTPSKKAVLVSKHLNGLQKILHNFQQEIELNLQNSTSAKQQLDYLSKTNILFLNAFMFFEGSFELLLFPDENIESKTQRITSFKKAHVLIYNQAIQFIKRTIKHIKYAFKNNILFENILQLSKYVIVGKTCKAIDIIELGYALYHTGFFINRTGEALQLYEFIENLGRFFGMKIINMQQLEKTVKLTTYYRFKLTT